MVTCTRACCYGPETCPCTDTRSKKRPREDTNATSHPYKLRKISTRHARTRTASRNIDSLPLDTRAYPSSPRKSRKWKGTPGTEKTSQDPPLPTPSRSNYTPRCDTLPRVLSHCGQTCPGRRGSTLQSPILCVHTAQSETRDDLSTCSTAEDAQEASLPPSLEEHGIIDTTKGFAHEKGRAAPSLQSRIKSANAVCTRSGGSRAEHECPEEGGSLKCNDVYPLGPSITPPKNPRSPPEHATVPSYDSEFLHHFMKAYRWSKYSDALRAQSYGADVAAEYRRGFTPEEIRSEWNAARAQETRELEELSDDDSYDAVALSKGIVVKITRETHE